MCNELASKNRNTKLPEIKVGLKQEMEAHDGSRMQERGWNRVIVTVCAEMVDRAFEPSSKLDSGIKPRTSSLGASNL